MTYADTIRLDTASMANTDRKDMMMRYVQMEGNVRLTHAEGAILESVNTLKRKANADLIIVLMHMKNIKRL